MSTKQLTLRNTDPRTASETRWITAVSNEAMDYFNLVARIPTKTDWKTRLGRIFKGLGEDEVETSPINVATPEFFEHPELFAYAMRHYFTTEQIGLINFWDWDKSAFNKFAITDVDFFDYMRDKLKEQLNKPRITN